MQVNASVDEYKNESKDPNSALKSKTEKETYHLKKHYQNRTQTYQSFV